MEISGDQAKKGNGVVCESALAYGIEEPNAIRWARLRAGITTQRQLSRITGLHPTIINELERGKRTLNPKWALLIAAATGVNWQDLMREDE
jgi:transcriptional regulator with XRE-family HTH domain